MNYQELLTHLKNRRDYFKSIGFDLNAKDLDDAIKAIEDLLSKDTDTKEEDSNSTKNN